MNKPLLTVVVTTYKRDEFLKSALRGILTQRYEQLEVIVIDDNPDQYSHSTETAVKKISEEGKVPIKYIKNKENLGMSNGHQLGFSEANGQYIVFHDDDDYYIDDNWFDNAINIMAKDPELSFVGGRSFAFSATGKVMDNLSSFGKIESKRYLQEFTTIGKPLSTFAAIFDKRKLEEAGFGSMLIANDTTIYLRSLLRGGGFIIDEFIGMYRVHSNSLTKSIDADTLLLHIDEKEKLLSELNWTLAEKNIFYLKQSEMNLGYYILRNNQPEYKKVFNWINQKPKKNRKKLKLIASKFIVKKYFYQFCKTAQK
ncbi:glycosyltransferase family 2 protein [Leuconostoc suionicum]|uniref:glycosyltransferase family 2 protein n=1 Tax=Leuconostoc TaxID=1243 RepID=UPI000761EE28|nr:glycosyltransferase family 2 protein [Leuconostoc mesenteroides]